VIKSVSYSRLSVFEACPYQAELKFIKKEPEPPTPTGVETPLDRGSRVHKDAELYVLGQGTITSELAKFEDDLYQLHSRFIDNPASIELEQMWCFDEAWQPTEWNDWDNIWLRIKQDVVVHLSEYELLAIDHKTGRKAGNEVKHNDQLRLAVLGAAFKYPEVDEFHIENWYTDQDEITSYDFNRDEVMDFLPEFNQRLLAVTTATEFEPHPSERNCRFCPYRTGRISKFQVGTGSCPHSYYKR